MTVLEKVRETRASIETEIDEILADETRAMSPEGVARLAELNTQADEIAEREKVVEESERRSALAAEAAAKLPANPEKKDDETHVSGEPRVYARGNGQSYFLDLARAHTGMGDPGGAIRRLQLHALQLSDELSKRDGSSPFELRGNIRNGLQDPSESRTNPNRTDGTGGYFVPPTWLIDRYVALFRAGRTTADLAMQLPLPGGTDSINIPKINTGTAAAVQTADAAAVASTDLTDTSVSSIVTTVAGQQDIAMQLLDQSPIPFDEVTFQDLARAYAVATDKQVLSGTNANNQVKGVLTMTGTNAVTYTDSSPTGPELWPFLMGAISQASYAAGGHFDLTSTAFVMHPRRWFWLLGQLDGNQRPLVTPDAYPGFNAVGQGSATVAVGRVGTLGGVPVHVDSNIPTNTGAGTVDQILFLKTDDLWLFESAVRTRVLSEVLSGTLQVRCQMYGYLAFIPDRLPGAHSVISGTGLAAPTGF